MLNFELNIISRPVTRIFCGGGGGGGVLTRPKWTKLPKFILLMADPFI